MPKRILAATAAFMALSQPSLAHAKQNCIAAADLSSGVIYAMPIAYDAMASVCEKQLKPSGFVATKGDAFIAPFRDQQGKAWPGAFRMLKNFIGNDAGANATGGMDINAMVSNLPESSLRPFVDGLLGQMIAQEIEPKNCLNIERALELLSPLPTENVGGLMAFIAEVSDIKNPSVCAPKLKRGKSK